MRASHQPRQPPPSKPPLVKAEWRESEVDSVKFVVNDEEFPDVKPEVKVELDPGQITARVAAINIR